MKYLLSLALLCGLVSIGNAAVKAPKDGNGQTLPTLDFVGSDSCRLTISDTTSATLCTSGAGLVYGVVFSSAAATNYVVLRDSATANTSSTPLIAPWADDANEDEGAGTVVIKLPVPVKFTNGLSANMASSLTGVGEAVILYRKQSATE